MKEPERRFPLRFVLLFKSVGSRCLLVWVAVAPFALFQADSDADFFGSKKPVLTVSSQLHLEAMTR